MPMPNPALAAAAAVPQALQAPHLRKKLPPLSLLMPALAPPPLKLVLKTLIGNSTTKLTSHKSTLTSMMSTTLLRLAPTQKADLSLVPALTLMLNLALAQAQAPAPMLNPAQALAPAQAPVQAPAQAQAQAPAPIPNLAQAAALAAVLAVMLAPKADPALAAVLAVMAHVTLKLTTKMSMT